ncbi:TIGR04219 family outer membrane beta-barrel protein [Thalassotalea fusca]
MKKTALALSTAALFTLPVQADVLGLYVGGQIWDNTSSGTVGESNNLQDFNLGDEQQGSFFIAVEHPLPFIPNVKVASTTLDSSGSTTLTADFEFGGETFNEGTVISSDFNVDYVDYTLYYEIFDNGLFSFDVGLTGRDFGGDVKVAAPSVTTPSDTITGSISTSEIVPMLYVSTQIGIAATDLNVYAEGNFLSFDDHTMYDYQAGISYELIDNALIDVNLTLGYRAVSMQLEDLNDLYTDIEFKGAYAGAVVHF